MVKHGAIHQHAEQITSTISLKRTNKRNWDTSILITLLLNSERPKTLTAGEIQQLDHEDQRLEKLQSTRNHIAHHPSKSISDAEFNQLWTDLVTILVQLGGIAIELDKLKDDSVFDSSHQSIDKKNENEASNLNSLGKRAYKDGKFSEAITFFTKAADLSGVANHDRAVFFCNMAASRLALYEQQKSQPKQCELKDANDERYRALQDAKKARELHLTRWKGHFRVGKVYAAMNEHGKAITSFERALALAPTNDEVQKASNESRHIRSEQLSHVHLDPSLKPMSMPERWNEFQQKYDNDIEKMKAQLPFMSAIDPCQADLLKGHQYEHGDIDVKQDYKQAAKYFKKAADQGNAEGLYNLARLTDAGLGVQKDHNRAQELFEQAAAQPPQHPKFKGQPNYGVADAEHVLGIRYSAGVVVPKHLATAAYWYERAVNHGSSRAANNLGLMYYHGYGVDRNIDKAKQLFEQSARQGDGNSMQSLAKILLDENNFEMAKIWLDRACEAGYIPTKINRDEFEKILRLKKQLIDKCSPEKLQRASEMKNVLDSLKTSKSASTLSDQSQTFDYFILNEHANRGSETARKMCDALEHFSEAFHLFKQTDTLTENEEDMVVHELSQCFRIEHIVAELSIEMRLKVKAIVDRVLDRCGIVSQLDEDARTCYASLRLDSPELLVPFLDSCKQMYPKSIYFHELSAAAHAWLEQYQDTLYNANLGLTIDPNCHQLIYDKAGALRLLGINMREAIEAYRAFLAVAPKDHRRVPDAYYTIAYYSFQDKKHQVTIDALKRMYQQGEEAEKIQLPCFLPYDSTSKSMLQYILNIKTSTPISDHRKKLEDPHRKDVLLMHRKWQNGQKDIEQRYNIIIPIIPKSRVEQRNAESLVGLKPITLREMNPANDHVYEEHVLSVTIIDEAFSWIPSIHIVIEDEHHDCEQMFIFNYPAGEGEYYTREVFRIGYRMQIINPYLRLGAYDRKPLIRINDFSSIVMGSESERIVNMCRCCGVENAPHVCSKCKQARYCSKECKKIDWQSFNHELICQKQ